MQMEEVPCVFSGENWEWNMIHYCACLKSGAENQVELVDESIQHAKDAIALDVKDGNSWCKILNKLLYYI